VGNIIRRFQINCLILSLTWYFVHTLILLILQIRSHCRSMHGQKTKFILEPFAWNITMMGIVLRELETSD
jgi:hypothetical protein